MVASTKSVQYLDQSLDDNYIAGNILIKGNSRFNFSCRHTRFLKINLGKLFASALIQCLFDYVLWASENLLLKTTNSSYILFWTCMSEIKNQEFRLYISRLTGKCAAQKLKSFSLWPCLHHMVI